MEVLDTNFEDDFKKFYEHHLMNDFYKLEAERIKWLLLWILVACCMIIVGWCGYDCFKKQLISKDALNLISFGEIFALAFVSGWPNKKFKTKVKKDVVEIVLSFLGRFMYRKEKATPEDLQECAKLYDFDRSNTDDVIEGEYGECYIKIIEANLLKRRDFKEKEDSKVFEGAFIFLEFNKNYFEDIKLSYFNKAFYLWFNLFFLIAYVLLYSSGGFDEILFLFFVVLFHIVFIFFYFFNKKKTRKIDYLKNYMIDSNIKNDEIFRILKVGLIENIYGLNKSFNGKVEKIYFNKNRIIIAIGAKGDLFDVVNIFKKTLSYKSVRKMIGQFCNIYKIIDFVENNYKEN